MDNNAPQIDPRTLSELVPAQTLAKALLEAEEYLTQSILDLSYYIHLATKAKTKNKWIDSEIYKITMTLERLEKTLAQIQRIKKGEIPADKYLPAPKEDVERALDVFNEIVTRYNVQGSFEDEEIETIRRVLLANAGRKE